MNTIVTNAPAAISNPGVLSKIGSSPLVGAAGTMTVQAAQLAAVMVMATAMIAVAGVAAKGVAVGASAAGRGLMHVTQRPRGWIAAKLSSDAHG